MTKPSFQPTLSESFAELEEIVAEFEQGKIDLENSPQKFKRGLELAGRLKKRLKITENQIIKIKDEFKNLDEKETFP